MKDAKFLFIVLMCATALGLTACAKQNSEFAARYARNKMGAQVADGKKTQAAGERAAAQGLQADVVGIERYWTPEGQPGPRVVISKILINDREMPVTTHHFGTEIAEGQVEVNGYTVVFHAMCGRSEDCNPYYAALEVYQNGKMVIQEGVRKYFEKTSANDKDLYQWFQPNEALPLLGSSVTDTRGMVGYLNAASTTAGSGIVK
ncbi:hypothetical protein QJS83_11210 [Bdellovibrio sp. 22V]|uniref:hypothetical protein n=1 Tax=Bdellovibrio TaxID=958 RepID=UPI0025439F44|nr:hypothetical protein [Bdellovibrio sp. 22V]WII71030.1 hypothetical protein QJS83_11210 [Bdellovibrio sp. 22V]